MEAEDFEFAIRGLPPDARPAWWRRYHWVVRDTTQHVYAPAGWPELTMHPVIRSGWAWSRSGAYRGAYLAVHELVNTGYEPLPEETGSGADLMRWRGEPSAAR